MSPCCKRSQREALSYLWNEGIRNAKEIHLRTGIPHSTIYENIKKLRKTGTTEHRRGNGRPKKITGSTKRTIGQYINRNPYITSRTLATKLANTGITVSYSTVLRYLVEAGYTNSLPKKTPMLTFAHKQARVEWAQKHLDDNWGRMFFSDETAFQLFRNTVKRWHKGSRPVRPIPKDRTKIKAWGGFWKGGKSNLFCFKEIINAEFYTEILRNNIPDVKEKLGEQFRWQ
jgi:transposase